MVLDKEKILFLAESNKIEGIDLDWENPKDKHVANSVSALEYVLKNYKKKITLRRILWLHHLQMKGLHRDAGKLRKGEVYICIKSVNPAYFMLRDLDQDVPIHLVEMRPTLRSGYVPEMMRRWLENTGGDIRKNHYQFESIHPFSDGNGRVGRLLWAWETLKQGKPLEFLEYYDGWDFGDKRQAYYDEITNHRKFNVPKELLNDYGEIQYGPGHPQAKPDPGRIKVDAGNAGNPVKSSKNGKRPKLTRAKTTKRKA